MQLHRKIIVVTSLLLLNFLLLLITMHVQTRLPQVLQILFPVILLTVGIPVMFSGLALSSVCPISGIVRLLLGVMPCLAGGYHVYCLASSGYISHKEQQFQYRFCIGLYAAALLIEVTLYQMQVC